MLEHSLYDTWDISGPFKGLANVFGIKILHKLIFQNGINEIRALELGPNLHVSAITSTIRAWYTLNDLSNDFLKNKRCPAACTAAELTF
jgi:hypothetical protein